MSTSQMREIGGANGQRPSRLRPHARREQAGSNVIAGQVQWRAAMVEQDEPIHVPVLMAEVINALSPQAGGVYADGTLGGGGHARALAEAVGPQGCVVAVDRDPAAVAKAAELLRGLPVRAVHANYADLPEVLDALKIELVDGFLLDLGLSSDQLADRQRGFSFSLDGPLDLRFDPTGGEPAARLVNRLSEQHLAELIWAFGEERYSKRIARAIVEYRQRKTIKTSGELAELVRRSVPRPPRGERIDPATRTFQALRIAVNQELKWLDVALRRLPDRLRPGGRIAVISFHSLEDRKVKEAFRGDERLEVLTRKPITAGAEELAVNPRARSAKLRVAVRR